MFYWGGELLLKSPQDVRPLFPPDATNTTFLLHILPPFSLLWPLMITTLLLERTLKPLWVPAFVPAPCNRHLDSSSVAQFPLPFCQGTKGDRRLTIPKSLSIMLRTRSLTLRQWAGGGGGNGAEEPVWPAPEEGVGVVGWGGHVKQRWCPLATPRGVVSLHKVPVRHQSLQIAEECGETTAALINQNVKCGVVTVAVYMLHIKKKCSQSPTTHNVHTQLRRLLYNWVCN